VIFRNRGLSIARTLEIRYRTSMESIIRKVDELNTDERRMYESVVGHALREDQRLIIHVVELGAEPDGPTRKAASQRAIEIARRGRASAADQGVTPEEADRVIDEAIHEVRCGKP
jgi:hypothetical protein